KPDMNPATSRLRNKLMGNNRRAIHQVHSRHRNLTAVFLFSPKSAFWPVKRALINSRTSTAFIDGPSQISAFNSPAWITHTFGSFGPSHHIESVLRQSSAAFI